jgi:hypothetical protein
MRLSNFIFEEMVYKFVNPLKEYNIKEKETAISGIFLMNITPSPLFTR